MGFDWGAAASVLSFGFGALISLGVVVFVFGYVGAFIEKNTGDDSDWKGLAVPAACTAAIAAIIMISAVWTGVLS